MTTRVNNPAAANPATTSRCRAEDQWRRVAAGTVIKYCLEPPGTFEIVGTDIKGIKKLNGVTKALHKHKALNPCAKYELVSEVKCPPDGARQIISAVARAGIKLEHFWAVRSSSTPGTAIGSYGVGYVDIIERYQNAR